MRLTRLLPFGLATLLAACAGLPDSGSSQQPTLAYTLSENEELLRLDTRAPQTVQARVPVTGLGRGDQLIALSLRAADNQLYALARSGQLYRVDAASGVAQKMGTGATPAGTATFGTGTGISGIIFSGDTFGVDFNPVADRLRVVSDRGQNLRIDPATSVAVDGDPAVAGRQPDASLRYAADDVNAGKAPAVVAVAYARDAADPQRTTAYAIDRELGTLVLLGSRAGATPAVSPDTGTLRTIGSLGLGRLRDASLDIDARTGRAFAVVRTVEDLRTRLFSIDLQSGRARAIGVVEQGRPVRGLAIAP